VTPANALGFDLEVSPHHRKYEGNAMSEKPSSDKPERLLALLGLAAHTPLETGPCPSDEELATLIDESLDQEERKTLLAHLNRCPVCYRHWVELSAYLDSPVPVTEPAVTKALWPKLWTRFMTRRPAWRFAVAGVAISLVTVALVTLWSYPPVTQKVDFAKALDHSIATQYTKVQEQLSSEIAPESLQALQNLPLPWARTALAFDKGPPAESERAFAAGLWVGRAVLLGTQAAPPPALTAPHGHAWSQSDWAAYHLFGQWTVLTWMLAQPELLTAELRSQEDVLDSLLSRFVEQTSTDPHAAAALAAIAQLKPLLRTANETQSPQAQSDLSRALVLTMQRLSPSTL
jgi:hypothetical protein